MISTHLLQLLFIPLLLSLIPVAFAASSCPNALLEMRLNETDFPALLRSVNMSGSIPYTLVYLCRAHSFAEPTWVTNVILSVTFGSVNSSYFAILYYECNSSSSVSPPSLLIPATATSSSTDQVYLLKNNSNADFCHNCANNSSINFCESCDSTCDTTQTDDLDFCYGPAMNQCCNYIQDTNCASQCNDTYYPNDNSVCTLCDIDCGANKTQNNASCDCVCSLGYSGDQCDTHICDQNPCNNGGNCSAIGTLAQPNTSCVCPTGYNGAYCDISSDPCGSSPCNNGNCTMVNSTNYNCTCYTGFLGSDCSYSDPCMNSSQCNYNGICNTIERWPYFFCNCTQDVTGDKCQYNMLCSANVTDPCQNNGECTADGADEYNCTCATGYTGDVCQTLISAVSGSPVAAIAIVLIILIILIAVIIIILVVVLIYFFYVKPKKGTVEISKKTSKVHPTNGDNEAVDEKAPILEKHKH